jgi:two-component system sensor histidine kinase KdpD
VLDFLRKWLAGYVAGVGGVVAVALILWPFYPDVRALTAASSLLMVVLVVAVVWGMAPALLASVLGALCLNFFYVPPLLKFDFHIDGTEDLIGLVTFLVTAITVGQLSSRAQQRAREIGQLYHQLQAAFDRASQLEGVKRSEQFKSALLDTVTHDLRTPLTSIKAAASTLITVRDSPPLQDRLSPSEGKLLAIIVKQCDLLDRFIEGMIELAEIESSAEGVPKLVETTPMDEIIIAALARAEDALRDHQVQVECDEHLSTVAHSKATAQVLFSLLENAGKYTPPGTMVRITAEWDEFEEIRIAVEDEGPGIPVALREKVFEKFFRGNAVARSNAPVTGLGLGLAIARRIVEVQGGKIWIEERGDGKTGARFVFTLPAQPLFEPVLSESVATPRVTAR